MKTCIWHVQVSHGFADKWSLPCTAWLLHILKTVLAMNSQNNALILFISAEIPATTKHAFCQSRNLYKLQSRGSVWQPSLRNSGHRKPFPSVFFFFLMIFLSPWILAVVLNTHLKIYVCPLYNDAQIWNFSLLSSFHKPTCFYHMSNIILWWYCIAIVFNICVQHLKRKQKTQKKKKRWRPLETYKFLVFD